jgi:Peptidase family M23
MRPIALTFCALAATLQLLPGTALAAGGWTWPVRGPVITAYRVGDDPYAAGQHRGVDIGAGVGSRVVAATGGTVTFAGAVGSSGLLVSERTADGRFDLSYLHLSSVSARRGETVAAGAALGAVGTSGHRSAEAPHLHFGVRDAGSRSAYRDPLDFLGPPPAGDAPDPAPVPVPVAEPALTEVASAPASHAAAPVAPLVLPALPVAGPASAALPVLPLAGHATSVVPSAAPAPGGARAEGDLAGSAPASHAGAGFDPSEHYLRGGATPGHLAAPSVARGPHAAEPSSTSANTRAASGSRGTHHGVDFGWLAACLGLIAAATALGHPDGTRRVAARGRARVGALLRPASRGN